MIPPPAIRAAYERGRLRSAAVAALAPALLVAALGGIGHLCLASAAVGTALTACFFWAQWRGMSVGSGARLGFAAGAVPLALAVAIVGFGCVDRSSTASRRPDAGRTRVLPVSW